MFYKLAVVGATTSTIYFVSMTLADLYSKKGTFPIINSTLKIIQSDKECTKLLPPPYSVNGHCPLRANTAVSRPLPRIAIDGNGREIAEIKYYIQSSNRKEIINGGINWAQVDCKSVDGRLIDLRVIFQNGKIVNLLHQPMEKEWLKSKFKNWFNKN